MDFPAMVTDTTNTHLDFHEPDSNFTFSENAFCLTSNATDSFYYYAHVLTALTRSLYLFKFPYRGLS